MLSGGGVQFGNACIVSNHFGSSNFSSKMASNDCLVAALINDDATKTIMKTFTKEKTLENHTNDNNNDTENVTYNFLKKLQKTNTNNNNVVKYSTTTKVNSNGMQKSVKSLNENEFSHQLRMNTEMDDMKMDLHGDESNDSAPIDVVGCDLKRNVDHSFDVVKKSPDHHARRPMNAFLIFCKRHRAIVREKYPNLENRSITKILGDWWANLEKEEKVCYTELAKQYKDAFFMANPDFKWYKLPAPPLRSHHACNRSVTSERSDSLSDPACDSDDGKSIQCKKPEVGLFKLADEAQMGGLNSLMRAVEVVNGNARKNSTSSTKDSEALHQELAITRSYMEQTMKDDSDDNIDVFTSVPYQQNASDKCIPSKWPRKSANSPDKCYEFDFYDDEISSGDSTNITSGKKSSRACKGKRYIEFMNANKLNPIAKKGKSRTTSTSSSSSPHENQLRHFNLTPIVRKMQHFDSFDHSANVLMRTDSSDADVKETEQKKQCEKDTVKPSFDAIDFDLEEKIKALPGRSLDKYLSRKRDTKKRKKISRKRSTYSGNRKNASKKVISEEKKTIEKHAIVEPPKTIQEAKERLMMVGSQKRKARKESITRRDIKSIISITDEVTAAQKNEANESIALNGGNNSTNGAANLLFLAAVAEADANFIV